MSKRLKKIAAIITVTMLLGGVLAGCGSSKNSNKNTNPNETVGVETEKDNTVQDVAYSDDSYIIDAEWLSNNLDNEDVLVLDARGDDPYNKGHIPGAISVTWQQFTDMNEKKPGDKGWGVLLNAEELSKKLSSIGVEEDKTIITYCDTKNGWGEDARIVWMLRRAGLENTKMLDGGWNYWKSNKYEVSKENVSPIESNFKIEELKKDTTIDIEELKANLSNVKILDSRTKEEYEGATKYGEARGGYLPNAILLPFTNLLNENGTFKTATEMEKVFKDAGLKKDDEIVTYCTAGIRSAHLALMLKMMGYNNVKNYDASYYEWAGDKSLDLGGSLDK